MIWLVLNPALDSFVEKRRSHCVAPAVAYEDRKQVRDHRSIVEIKLPHTGNCFEPLDIPAGELVPFRSKLVPKSLELNPADGGKDVAHVVAPALFTYVKFPTSLAAKSFLGVVGDTKQPGIADPMRDLLVPGHYCPTLSACDVLDSIEAEADHFASRSDRLALPGT